MSALPESPKIPSGRITAKITRDPQRVSKTEPVVVSGAPFPPIIASKGDRVAADQGMVGLGEPITKAKHSTQSIVVGIGNSNLTGKWCL